jgi:hypothetical protein
MKILLTIILITSFSSFARSPAVNPGFKVKSFNGKSQKDYAFINGQAIELSNIGFKGKGVPTLKRKIKRKTPINLAPTFLLLFALSVPAFAWIFIRDEEILSHAQEGPGQPSGEILEVDFSKNKIDENEKFKKAS